MKVKVDIRKTEEVYLSDRQSNEIAIKVLRETYNLPEGCYLKDFISEGFDKQEIWTSTEVSYGSHSDFEEERYRAAGPSDEFILGIIADLSKV